MTRRFAKPHFIPVRVAALLIFALLASTGCSKNKRDKGANEGLPAETIYEKAHKQMTNGNWSGAELTFKRLVAQYPYGAYTEQAMIETAYAQYKAGKHDEAVSSIDRFIRTYPTHEKVPYMYYLRGLSNANRDTVFLQKVWSLDSSRRDLSAPFQAYNDFNLLVERYPNSKYAGDAAERMITLRNIFAEHELENAIYYLRRDANISAVGRALYLLETYPQSKYQNDAIAVLGEAYTRLGEEKLAASTRSLLQEKQPDHPWLNSRWPHQPWLIRGLNPFAGEKEVSSIIEKK